MNTEINDIKILNKYGAIGITKISKLYRKSTKTIQKILKHSVNNKDIHNITNRVYKPELANDIEYFVDASIGHLNNVKAHFRGQLKNFPNMYFISNRRGQLVSYYLSKYLNEISGEYLKAIREAQLPKGSIIHVDMYSTKLFNILESEGYKVCHINKRLRSKPYFNEVEHLFSNIQKTIRRLQQLKTFGDLRVIDKQLAFEIVKGLIELYHRNNPKPYLELLHRIIRLKQQITKDPILVKCIGK